MPLYDDGPDLIRINLEGIERDEKVSAVEIGRLTDEQHAAINALRRADGLPSLECPEIVLIGKHVYNSRVVRDHYTIDDVIAQIESALAANSIVLRTKNLTALDSVTPRADGYGNVVRDRAALELTQRKPRAELFFVIPRGDLIRPRTGKKERPLESGLENLEYSPG